MMPYQTLVWLSLVIFSGTMTLTSLLVIGLQPLSSSSIHPGHDLPEACAAEKAQMALLHLKRE